MDFQINTSEQETGLTLRMSYEISAPNTISTSLSHSVTETLRHGVNQILIPMNSIYGISKTVSRSNPQCAASVRYNAANIFGIVIEPRATAEIVISNLKEEITSGKRIGAIGENIASVVAEGYTSIIIYMNSPKYPKSGHIAKVFQKFSGELFVIDTEIKVGNKRTGKPIPLDVYLDFLNKSGRNIKDVIGLPTDRVAI